MKKRLQYINLGLMLLVILTLAVQSIHIYYHQHDVIEHVCDGNQDQHDHEDCEVCDFVFSYFVATPIFYYPFLEKNKPQVAVSYPIEMAKLTATYAKPQRGPPVFL